MGMSQHGQGSQEAKMYLHPVQVGDYSRQFSIDLYSKASHGGDNIKRTCHTTFQAVIQQKRKQAEEDS